MRIVCISDTHNQLDRIEIPDGDVLIHCGDLTGRGSVSELRTALKHLKALKERFKRLICIAGNHDFGLEPERQSRAIPVIEEYKEVCDYLQDEAVDIDGVKFYGTPWTPVFYDWAFMDDEEGLKKRFSLIPSNTEVLISHGPPKHILDRTDSRLQVGSKALYTRCQELPELKAVVFGHIHEAYGHYTFQGVDYYNCSVVSSSYRIQNPPTIIDL